MRSMTGFGRGTALVEGRTVQVEISSVNRKNLDVQVNMPGGLAGLEALVRRRTAERVRRGRLQIRVLVDAGMGNRPVWREEVADRLLREVNAFARERNLRPLESAAELLRLPGVFQEAEAEAPTAEWSAAVEAAVEEALAGLVGMRTEEGRRLKETLAEQVTALSDLVARFGPLVEEARGEREAKLREAAARVGELEPEMQTRLLQEIALYGEKTDVREEVDRLRAHLAQTKAKLEVEEPVGRALDFLCQEMAREFNTLGVKAARADINQVALEGKERVETLREQVQNVE